MAESDKTTQPIGLGKLLTRLQAHIAAFFLGAAMSWISVPYILQRRTELERLFILMTTGDLMGIPLSPPPSSLWLLPFMVPQILHWRRRLKLWDADLETAHIKHLGH